MTTTGWSRWGALAAAAMLGCAAPAGAQQPPAGFQACESMRGPAWCGDLAVPENRDVATSRTIRLRVKILRATSAPGEPGSSVPVFFLAGGPGQAAADIEPLVIGRFAARLPERDFVLVDQRGTGGSHPLGCATDAPNDPTRFFGPAYTEGELRACLRALGERADLTRYRTLDYAHDLDSVRRSLGYGTIDVVGGSYGSQAALVYMRAFPRSVRSAVLEGVAPPSFLNPLPAARGSQEALDALFRDCAADAQCGRIFPDMPARLAALLERLDAEPADVAVPGTAVTAPLDRDALAFLVHVLLFSPNSAVMIPPLVAEVENGGSRMLTATYAQVNESLVGGIDFGLQLAVTCTETAPFLTDAEIDSATRGTYLGRSMVDGVLEECAEWPRGTLPEGFLEPVTVDVPTLLLSGALDPATPVAFAESVAAALPRVRHLVIGAGAHITAHPCTDQLVVDFLRAGDAAALDASCIDEIRRPPFFTGTAILPAR